MTGDFDVVVLGAGLAGLSAAVTAVSRDDAGYLAEVTTPAGPRRITLAAARTAKEVEHA